MLNELKSNSDRISLLTGFGRVCHGIQALTKTTVQNTGIINQGKSTDVGLGKKTKLRIVMTEVRDAGFLV